MKMVKYVETGEGADRVYYCLNCGTYVGPLEKLAMHMSETHPDETIYPIPSPMPPDLLQSAAFPALTAEERRRAVDA